MRNIQQLFVALIITMLAACGGGGTLDSGGSTGGTSPVYSLSVALTNANGQTSTALSQASPLTATVTLTATNGGSVANKVISFNIVDSALATLNNSLGTALTNSSGVATIGLLVGSKSGAGNLDVSYNDVTQSVGFVSAGDGGGNVDVTVGSVSLIADSLMLGSGSGNKVELSALVRDTNNVVLANIPVSFATDSGELVQTDAVTSENGVARAVLETQTDKQLRDITVTARVQQKSSVLKVSVVGTKLELAAPKSVVLGDTVTIDIFLTDSSDTGVQGEVVEVTSLLDNTLSITSPVTATAAGKASFTYTAVYSGTDKITVSALGSSSSTEINISADEFTFLPMIDTSGKELLGEPVQEVPLNSEQSLIVEWLSNGTPKDDETVTFNTTRGVIADKVDNLATAVTTTSQTGSEGKAQAFVRSNYAGFATISASAGTNANEVSAGKVIEFVAKVPSKVEVQVFPAQVGPGETSAVRAIVRDNNNNPVKGETVVFTLDNSAGGVISAGTAKTNSQGIASTVFTADTNTGAAVGGENLNVKGTLQTSPAIFDEAGIAVGKRTLFFRFGTGNIIRKPSESTYAQEFSIIVTDSSGNPVANQPLNVAVVSTRYRKGQWVASPTPPAAFKQWLALPTASCESEDANYNGILDVEVDASGNIIPGTNEDINLDGVLTPGNVVTVPRTVTADENGIATFLISYPRDYAVWTDVHVQVSGTAAGTENVSYREYMLAIAGDDTTNESTPPPVNPFGYAAICSDKN